MNKNARIEQFATRFISGSPVSHSPFYLGYFSCFNAGQYYEAHDVLEHLWLQDRSNLFYKGLIQLAGGFVHLQKQSLRPWHPKDGNRLRPAARLFALAIANLSQYPALFQGFDVSRAIDLCQSLIESLESSDYAINPWRPDRLPELALQESQ